MIVPGVNEGPSRSCRAVLQVRSIMSRPRYWVADPNSRIPPPPFCANLFLFRLRFSMAADRCSATRCFIAARRRCSGLFRRCRIFRLRLLLQQAIPVPARVAREYVSEIHRIWRRTTDRIADIESSWPRCEGSTRYFPSISRGNFAGSGPSRNTARKVPGTLRRARSA